jgi:hypothetical protein
MEGVHWLVFNDAPGCERYTPIRHIPMRCTPMRHTPVRCTPVRYTLVCEVHACICKSTRYTPPWVHIWEVHVWEIRL